MIYANYESPEDKMFRLVHNYDDYKFQKSFDRLSTIIDEANAEDAHNIHAAALVGTMAACASITLVGIHIAENII